MTCHSIRDHLCDSSFQFVFRKLVPKRKGKTDRVNDNHITDNDGCLFVIEQKEANIAMLLSLFCYTCRTSTKKASFTRHRLVDRERERQAQQNVTEKKTSPPIIIINDYCIHLKRDRQARQACASRFPSRFFAR